MERILKRVYLNKPLFSFLRTLSHTASIFAALLFSLLVIKAFLISAVSALKLGAILGGAYIVVSIARWLIDAPRPYEIYDFYEVKPKNRKGLSFPSRHSFLVFAIATAALPAEPVLASILAVLGVFLAVSRVLSGIHFIRDVLTGALLGIISSLIGLLFLFPY